MKRSGLSVEAASRVIEIDEVLVAISASGRSDVHRVEKIWRLVASCRSRRAPGSILNGYRWQRSNG